jgi:serine/threonine protein kinase
MITFSIGKQVCFSNAFAWKNSEVMFVDRFHTFAVAMNNHSRHQLFYTDPLIRLYTEDVMLKTTSGPGPIRLAWLPDNNDIWNPNVYVYNTSLNSSEGFPIFQTEKMNFPPLAHPEILLSQTPVYNYISHTFYLYGGSLENGTGNMWALPVNVPRKSWWLTRPHPSPETYMSSCATYSQEKIIIFGGKYENSSIGDELWLYNTNIRTWMIPTRLSDSHDSWPRPRADCSLTSSFNGSIVLLFGGYSPNGEVLSDVWKLDAHNYIVASWKSINPVEGALIPPRFGHSSIIIGNELIIYGGSSKISDGYAGSSCLFDMWGFDVMKKSWRSIPVRGVQEPQNFGRSGGVFSDIFGMCGTFLVPFGKSRVIAGRRNVFPQSTAETSSNSIWMIDTSSLTYTIRHIPSPNISVLVKAAGLFAGSLVIYGAYNRSQDGQWESSLLSIGGTCELGFARINGPAEPCMPCPIGEYTTITLSVHQCVECPIGTTTIEVGASNITNCTCDPKYCVHGSCEYTGRDDVKATCKCSFGFLGERCNRTTYVVFLMSFGLLIVVIIVTTALALCGIRTARHLSARKRTEWELKETRKAFTIMPWEVKLLCRLDENCPGGYGQVHKAMYRDWTVAVKQLHLDMEQWADVRNEFLREIHFMRTVRHSNIVMFIGAGQHTEKQPFLVLEYMSGGALLSLLQNVEEELTLANKMQFILDTAEGMKYLHTLQPPRIHRDLKSANLLLSGTRRVKVADFGCARLIPQIGRAKSSNEPNSRSGFRFQRIADDDLLDERAQLTSRFIGTARWRSPELWQRKPYSTATDVYSFGIVMWEIVTRQTPFSGPEYRFDAKVEDAVLCGTRPPIPDRTLDDLSSLIKECWQDKPNSRPPFSDAVRRLHTMAIGLLRSRGSTAVFPTAESSTEITNRLHEMLVYDADDTETVEASVEIRSPLLCKSDETSL